MMFDRFAQSALTGHGDHRRQSGKENLLDEDLRVIGLLLDDQNFVARGRRHFFRSFGADHTATNIPPRQVCLAIEATLCVLGRNGKNYRGRTGSAKNELLSWRSGSTARRAQKGTVQI